MIHVTYFYLLYYYFVCAIGGQHDGHLPFWLPSFVKLIMLLYRIYTVTMSQKKVSRNYVIVS